MLLPRLTAHSRSPECGTPPDGSPTSRLHQRRVDLLRHVHLGLLFENHRKAAAPAAALGPQPAHLSLLDFLLHSPNLSAFVFNDQQAPIADEVGIETAERLGR